MHPAPPTRLSSRLLLTQHLDGEGHCVVSGVADVFSGVLSSGGRNEQAAVGTLLLQHQAAPSLQPDTLLGPAHGRVCAGQLAAQRHRLPRGHRHDGGRSERLQDPHRQLCKGNVAAMQSSTRTTWPWGHLCCQPQVSTRAGWPSCRGMGTHRLRHYGGAGPPLPGWERPCSRSPTSTSLLLGPC